MSENNIARLRNKFLKAYKEEDFLQAILIGERLLSMYEQNEAEKNDKYADDLYSVACVYGEEKNHERAIELYKRCAEFLSKTEGSRETLADVYNNLGIIYSQIRQPDVALVNFKKALKLRTDTLAPNHPDLIDIYYNLAGSYFDNGNVKKAFQYYNDSLKRRVTKDLAYSDNLNHLGYCYEAKGDFKNASIFLDTSLKIIKTIEGADSVEYMKNIYYLAGVYEKANMPEQAQKAYDKSVNLIKEHLGERHPYYAEALNKLSDILVRNGNEKKAMILKLKAVNIIKQTVGTDHVYYANTIKSLGDIYLNSEDYLKAGLMYTEALDVKKKLFGSNNSDYIKDSLILCHIYELQGKQIKGVELAHSLLSGIPLNNPLYRECLKYLVRCYHQTGDHESLNALYLNYREIDKTATFEDMLGQFLDINTPQDDEYDE